MASKLFRTPVELKNYMQVLCDKAIKATVEEAKSNLPNVLMSNITKILNFIQMYMNVPKLF